MKAKSPHGKHAKQLGNPEHILVVEFDYACATDAPGDPNRRSAMMVATDSFHGSIFPVVARRKRRSGRLCDAEFPKLYRSVGFG